MIPLDLDALDALAPPGPYTVHRVLGGCEIHATHLDRTIALCVPLDVASLLASSRTLLDELIEARRDLDDLHATLARQSAILRDTAIALRGDSPPLASWGHHDLAERAAALAAELRQERAIRRSYEEPR